LAQKYKKTTSLKSFYQLFIKFVQN
jgi:hypothetical protein